MLYVNYETMQTMQNPQNVKNTLTTDLEKNPQNNMHFTSLPCTVSHIRHNNIMKHTKQNKCLENVLKKAKTPPR